MSDPGKAVFLSYASQDAVAAKRICDAMRSGGVEVWFDADGGLEQGDEWDAKIRKQIKECVLFVPVISANTQSRLEGYFRVEWELASQRAMGIASGVPFVLPIVVDETREPDALVPDRFRAVQWTKLPGGEVPPEVLHRFLKLWSHRTGAVKHEAMSRGSTTEVGADPSSRRKRNPALIAGAILALVVVLVALALWRPWQRSESDLLATRSSLPAASSPSEAQQLIAKAWDLMNRPGMAREELRAADDLCQQAAALDPNDADVWAAWSFVDAWYCYHSFDNTPERREGARSKAARALNLAPSSYEARLAQANYLVREGSDAAVSIYAPEADRLLRDLLHERPADPRALLSFAILQRNLGHADEARQALQTMAKVPGSAALAWHELAWVERRNGNPNTALELEDRSIAIQANWLNLTGKMDLLMTWQGDLDAAKVVLDQIPALAMQEDFTASWALQLHYVRRTPDALLRLADSIPRDWLQSNIYLGPLGWWKGQAEQQAGHPAAARVHWQAAMQLVERRLADAPSAPRLIAWRSRLLAVLGQTAEAEKTLQLARELGGVNFALERWIDEIRLGQMERALDEMESEYQTNPGGFWAAELRFSPEFDPVREHPRFIALLERMEADPRCSPNAKITHSQAGAPSVDAKSVAVLAFANLSDDKANEYFSDGISEELLNVLAKVPGLKVTARTSSFFFKGKETPIPEIAEKLGVAYVIEGSVRKQGDRVRITAQLIKAADGFHVWSDTFTRDLKDIFAVQDEIAGLIARSLSLTLATGTFTAQTAVDPRAFELYVQARQAWSLRMPEANDRAERLLMRVLELAPDFARAHAALADVWLMRLATDQRLNAKDAVALADKTRILARIEKALALDPESAEAHASLGLWHLSYDQNDEAEPPLRRAVALNPNYASAQQWLARSLVGSGRLDEALQRSKFAVELDPFAGILWDQYGRWLAFAGRYEEAIAAWDRAFAVQPDYIFVLGRKAAALAESGRLREAVALARSLPATYEATLSIQFNVYARAGLKAEAEAILGTIPPSDPYGAYRASGLIALGRTEEALAALISNQMSWSFRNAIIWSRTYDPLRRDPHWVKFVADNGLTEAHDRAQAWRAAHPAEKPEANP